MESAEEFTHAVIGIVRTITIRNGEEWTPFDQIKEMLAAHDAAIRAECAEMAIEYMHDLWDGWSDEELRAAIMAEPPKAAL